MNKQLLHQYLMFLLSDEKIAIIHLKADAGTVTGIVAGIMKAAAALPHYFAADVLNRLKTITVHAPDAALQLDLAIRRLSREQKWQKLYPWLALMITLLLCMAMYFFSKK